MNLMLALAVYLAGVVVFPAECPGMESAAVVARNPTGEWASLAATFVTAGGENYTKYFYVAPYSQGVARIVAPADVYQAVVWVYSPGRVDIAKWENDCVISQ